MQQLHHFRRNTCRHGAELSTCLCVSVCMSEALQIHSVSDLWERTHRAHTLTSRANAMQCTKSNACSTASLMQWCQHVTTNTHRHTHTDTHTPLWRYGEETAKYLRILFSSLASVLHPYIFNSLLPSPLHSFSSSLGWGILRFHDNHSGGGNGLDTLHCLCWGVWSLLDGGRLLGLWGVRLVKRDWGYGWE